MTVIENVSYLAGMVSYGWRDSINSHDERGQLC